MVIAQKDGSPTEERRVLKELKKLIDKTGLPQVVFHSLRHLSASMKLQFSGGDIKAVQVDTGHSQTRMVTDVYSHTFDANRRNMANLMENAFFSADTPTGKSGTKSKKTEQLITLLRENPKLIELLLAVAQTNIS